MMVKELRSGRHIGELVKINDFNIKCNNIFCFQHSSVGNHKFEVKPWFLNPYTDKRIYFVICPSHQVYQLCPLYIMHICMHTHAHRHTNIHTCTDGVSLPSHPTHKHEHMHTAKEDGVSPFPVLSKVYWRNKRIHKRRPPFWMEDMYKRELVRIRSGQISRVPELKESHVQRDSWTRLNVLPSKVMQVCFY